MEPTNQKSTSETQSGKGGVMWRCLIDLKMDNRRKETAFIKGNLYKQVGKIENGVELINEQGFVHSITGDCLRYFNAT